MTQSSRILITGGNTGIGKAIAKKLLAEGHRIVITSRDHTKGKQAVEELKQLCSSENVEFLVGDLSTVNSTLELAHAIRQRYSDLQILINNAGVWMTSLVLNEDGIEQSFMVNHVAPYLLTKELLPILTSNKPARIVNVNAGLYVNGKFDAEKTPIGADFSSIKTYANTKLCSVMTTLQQAREIEGSGVNINAVHPGVINTGLGDSPGLISKIMKYIKRFWKSPDYGAEAPAWLATDDSTATLNGKYFNEKKLHDPVEAATNPHSQQKLRELTDHIIETAVARV